MSAAISAQAREELEGVLMLLLSDIREYRDREQRHLADPAISNSDIMRTVGAVTALKNVVGVIEMLCELYKLNPENAGKLAAGGQAREQSRGGVRALNA